MNSSGKISRVDRMGGAWRVLNGLAMAGFAILMAVAITGCQTPSHDLAKASHMADSSGGTNNSSSLVLQEGDVVVITFPGSPDLDARETIRRDGKISMKLIGEVKAVGLTPIQLKEELLKLYANQITTKEVMVNVASSAFRVFVTGAVVHPGKILSDHPMTALEAIMEAGGFDFTKANLKAVKVIRNEDGQLKNYTLDLKGYLDGAVQNPFYLKPADIVYVKEKFYWF